MTEQSASYTGKHGKGPLNSCVEERVIAVLDTGSSKTHIQTQGERDIITVDQKSKMETITTSKATYVAHKSPGVRLQGTRRELLQKHFSQMMREKLHAELIQPTSKTDYQSTTQRDFCVQGFVPCRPPATQDHDYKTDQAITFWSENYKQIQGVTAARNVKAPFRKSAQFSTPISEQLDETELPPDN